MDSPETNLQSQEVDSMLLGDPPEPAPNLKRSLEEPSSETTRASFDNDRHPDTSFLCFSCKKTLEITPREHIPCNSLLSVGKTPR